MVFNYNSDSHYLFFTLWGFAFQKVGTKEMTYQKAIERAKYWAVEIQTNCVVYSYKSHWWQRTKYNYNTLLLFEVHFHPPAAVKLLTITPNGTIAQ